jgi:predicted transposase/invertase (TIGR01784 family)
MQNETFRRLLESVKLINFAEELFNCEVKKMTDVMAERENAFAEGKEVGRAEGASAERTKADQEKRQMAKSLKEQNVDVSIIAKSTGFSEEEIRSL